MKLNAQGCWNSIIGGSATKGFNDELTGMALVNSFFMMAGI
jgi:hypothetical protein